MSAILRLATISAALMSSTTFADDTASTEDTSEHQATYSWSAAEFVDELETDAHLALLEPVNPVSLTDFPLQPLNDVRFEDSDFLSRASKLRGLSVLTMAEFGHARLFFGVNDDGLVGLHFNTSASDPSGGHIEVLRMPYLAEDPDETAPE